MWQDGHWNECARRSVEYRGRTNSKPSLWFSEQCGFDMHDELFSRSVLSLMSLCNWIRHAHELFFDTWTELLCIYEAQRAIHDRVTSHDHRRVWQSFKNYSCLCFPSFLTKEGGKVIRFDIPRNARCFGFWLVLMTSGESPYNCEVASNAQSA